MTHHFPDDVLLAVMRHMNDDHAADSLLIARAHIDPSAVSARLIGFDGESGEWEIGAPGGRVIIARVPWPGGPINERAAVRREIVALFEEAQRKLALTEDTD